MFHTLIESGSQTRETKRRSSFFFATFAFYMLLLSGAGVAGIYAYNPQIDFPANDSDEVVIMRFAPVPKTAARPPLSRQDASARNHRGGGAQVAIVKEISIQDSRLQHRGLAREETPDVNSRTPLRLGEENFIPGNIGVPTDKHARGTGDGEEVTGGERTPRVLTPVDEDVPVRVAKRETPPAQPAPPQKITLASSVLTSKLISKPVPVYPKLAREAHAQGAVAVQIVVDEQGRVVSAQATGGHPLLRQVAVQAAHQARFTPTLLNGKPVKVSGVITYNFVLQ